MKLIASLLVFYPLIIPIWEKESLNSENSKLPESRYFLDRDQVAWQVEQIRRIKDPRIKSKIVFDLSRSNNPAAIPLLTGLLPESQEKLKTDILLNLYNMRDLPKTPDSSVYEPMMGDKNEQIGAYSSALYLNNSGSPYTVLKLINKQTTSFILNFIKNELF
jgi:hypothetical protein